jgi:CheY-like chemotaxis protein
MGAGFRMDGIEFLQHMRKDPKIAATPVIVLSASSEAETRLMLANRGLTAQSFLMKSQFALHVLLDRVAVQIAKSAPTANS